MIEIDGVQYYTIKEIVERKIASESTVKRRIKEKKLPASKNLNGYIIIKVEDITKFLKKNSAA